MWVAPGRESGVNSRPPSGPTRSSVSPGRLRGHAERGRADQGEENADLAPLPVHRVDAERLAQQGVMAALGDQGVDEVARPRLRRDLRRAAGQDVVVRDHPLVREDFRKDLLRHNFKDPSVGRRGRQRQQIFAHRVERLDARAVGVGACGPRGRTAAPASRRRARRQRQARTSRRRAATFPGRRWPDARPPQNMAGAGLVTPTSGRDGQGVQVRREGQFREQFRQGFLPVGDGADDEAPPMQFFQQRDGLRMHPAGERMPRRRRAAPATGPRSAAARPRAARMRAALSASRPGHPRRTPWR